MFPALKVLLCFEVDGLLRFRRAVQRSSIAAGLAPKCCLSMAANEKGVKSNSSRIRCFCSLTLVTGDW